MGYPTPLKQKWPKEALTRYEPLKELGRGGFASVVLARRRGKSGELLVAMKQVRAETNTQSNYAHREIYILRELSHPNIMRLIEYWEPDDNNIVTMAVSYAEGKTLDYLLETAGAPSLSFSRIVISQLVDAVAYLHSHAVIHRDIKPDNLVVKGIDLDDDSIFDDQETMDVSWPELRKKWHLTLLDFGFARALGPEDIEREPKTSKLHKPKKKPSRKPINRAASRAMLNMSAVGNRYYAAPEVKTKVHEEPFEQSCHKQVNNTLSRYVSGYSMVADAYSVGATARYILTGVHPEDDVDQVIANYNNPVSKLVRMVQKNKKKKRKKTFRSGSNLPRNGLDLIKGMTQAEAEKRMSVRDARSSPYIDQVMDIHNYQKDLSFLSFVKGEKFSKYSIMPSI